MKYRTTIVIECGSIKFDADDHEYAAKIIAETLARGAQGSVDKDREAKIVRCECEFTNVVKISCP